jgi:hypothetical protein
VITPTPFPDSHDQRTTIEEALAGIESLRARLDNVEREVALLRARQEAPPVPSGRKAEGDAARSSQATPEPTAPGAPLAAVLTGDEETASQHLAHLRNAISRLRDERAQAMAEFRSLTQPRRGDADPPDLATERAEIAGAIDQDMATMESAAVDEPWGFTPLQTIDDPEFEIVRATPVVARVPLAPESALTRNHHRALVDDTPAEAIGTHAAAVPAAATVGTAEERGAGGDGVRELREKLVRKEMASAPRVLVPAESDQAHRPRRRFAVLAAPLLIALAAVGWYLGPWRGPTPASGPVQQGPAQRMAPEVLPAPAPVTDGAPPAGRTTPSRPATPARQVPPAATGSPAVAAPLAIELATSREVWLRVVVDGARSLERTVPAGQTLRFEAKTSVQFTAGDAGAVVLTVNGESRGRLGADGQVSRRRIDASAPGAAAQQPR